MEFQVLDSEHNAELLKSLVSPQSSTSRVSVIDYDEQKNNIYYTNLLGSDVLYFVNVPNNTTYTLPNNYFLSKLFTQLQPGATKLWYVYTNGSTITLTGPTNSIILTSNLSILAIQALSTTTFQIYSLTASNSQTNGSTGPVGYAGPTGVNGNADTIGTTGLTGLTGIAGLPYASAGPTGNSSTVTTTGFFGYTGTVLYGPTGPTGSTTISGSTGPSGTFLYGSTGMYGISSNTGSTGSTGFYLQITQVFTNTPGPSPTFLSPGIPSTWTTSLTTYGGQLTILADLQANHTFVTSGGGRLPINFLIDGTTVGTTTFDWVATTIIPYFSVVNAFFPVNNISAGSHTISISIPFTGAQVSTSNVLNMTVLENVSYPNNLSIGQGSTGYTGTTGPNSITGATGPVGIQPTGQFGSTGISSITGATGWIGPRYNYIPSSNGSVIYAYDSFGTFGYTGTFLYQNSSLSVGTSINSTGASMCVSSSINPSLLKVNGTNTTTSDNASIYLDANFSFGSRQAGIFSIPSFSLSSATLNRAINFYISMNYTGSSSVTNSYGVYIGTGINNGNKAMTGYGLYVLMNPTGTITNNYCASFSGPIGIGMTPSYPVSVSGSVRALNLNGVVNSQILFKNSSRTTIFGIGATDGSIFQTILPSILINQRSGDLCIGYSNFGNEFRIKHGSNNIIRVGNNAFSVGNISTIYSATLGRIGLQLTNGTPGSTFLVNLKMYTTISLVITMQLLNSPFTTMDVTIGIVKIGSLTFIVWPSFTFTTGTPSPIVSVTPLTVYNSIFMPTSDITTTSTTFLRTASFIVPTTAGGNNQFGRMIIDSSGFITIYYDTSTTPFPTGTSNCGLLETTIYYLSTNNG